MKEKENQNRKTTRGVTWDDVEILVVGAGTMGASLAQAYAQSGFNVGMVDVSDEILERALQTIDGELKAGEKAGIFTPGQAKEIKRRILATSSYEQACSGKRLDLVIETATEDIEIKKEVFRKLDKLCAPHIVLASNTSSLDVNILANETNRPDKVVWMHYFYLPHKNRAGEFAGSDAASKESIDKAAIYMKLAGKVATPVLNSRKGGAADVIFVSLLLEAARMVDDGFDASSIEAAGKKAFGMPMGFLSLMDANGIPLGIHTMYSFSDSSNPDDPLYKAYHNFFTPPESYKILLDKYQKAEDRSSVRWVSEEEAQTEAKDPMLIDMLRHRFLAVAFMTSAEVVEAGVIEMDEVDKLCQNAFLWKEGPFALMNKTGMMEVMRIVIERMELSHRKEINFPIPRLLIEQAQKGEPWPLKLTPVVYNTELSGRAARITISNPRTSNALDNQVFEGLKVSFKKAEEDSRVKVIIFDSAPIKTFIAGANVSYFIKAITEGNWQGLKKDVVFWHDVVFHGMTGRGKPKIAIVDGAALGGGAEVALAFALDPESVVIATERTSFSFPEVRLGIYPGLRGTLTLPQIIYRATDDAELAVALSRYYILSGGVAAMSPKLLKYLGLADLLVPARTRDDTAEKLAQAVMDNGGKPLTREQVTALKIEELPSELISEEKDELGWIMDIFSGPDLIPALEAHAQGQDEIPLSGEAKSFAQRIAKKVADNSAHAVDLADRMVRLGFDEFLQGKSLDELAQYELDNYLEQALRHPDALEGLTAFVEKRVPQFKPRALS